MKIRKRGYAILNVDYGVLDYPIEYHRLPAKPIVFGSKNLATILGEKVIPVIIEYTKPTKKRERK